MGEAYAHSGPLREGGGLESHGTALGGGGTVQEDQRLMEKNTVPEDTSDSALARGTGVDSLRRPMTASTVEVMRLVMGCFELWNEHTQKKPIPQRG